MPNSTPEPTANWAPACAGVTACDCITVSVVHPSPLWGFAPTRRGKSLQWSDLRRQRGPREAWWVGGGLYKRQRQWPHHQLSSQRRLGPSCPLARCPARPRARGPLGPSLRWGDSRWTGITLSVVHPSPLRGGGTTRSVVGGGRPPQTPAPVAPPTAPSVVLPSPLRGGTRGWGSIGIPPHHPHP